MISQRELSLLDKKLKDTLPSYRTCLSIVICQRLEVKHIDDAIVVQICSSRDRGVITHANRQRIELIDDVVVVNITRRQSERRQTLRGACSECDRSLRSEETLRAGNYSVGAWHNIKAEASIWALGAGNHCAI